MRGLGVQSRVISRVPGVTSAAQHPFSIAEGLDNGTPLRLATVAAEKQPPAPTAPRAESEPAAAPRNGHAARVEAKNGHAEPARSTRRSSTEWDLLSEGSKEEIEQLVDALKAVKQGDFTVRFPYHRDGILSRAGELLNDIIGLNEHMASELVRVGKVVGQEGRMTRARVGRSGQGRLGRRAWTRSTS